MTAAIPAGSFRIATGFLQIVADRRPAVRETERFIRDTDRRMATGGRRVGNTFGSNLAGALMGWLRRITAAIFNVVRAAIAAMAKLMSFGIIVGTVAIAIGGLAAAIGGLGGWIGDLVIALVSASATLLLIPGAVVAVVAALAAGIVGFQGFGAAVSAVASGDVEKATEALNKIAPAAREAAVAFAAMKAPLDRLRLSVQQALFARWADQVHDLGRLWIPMLTARLTDMGAVVGALIHDVLALFNTDDFVLDWSNILRDATTAAAHLGHTLEPLFRILTDITAVSTQLFAQLTGGAWAAMNRFADLIAQMRADGSLEQMILDGVDALKSLGSLAGDLLGILTGIFGATGRDGSGVFSFFDRLNQLINSPGVQEALGSIFDSLGRLGLALTPVLVTILEAMVPIADGLAQIAVAFGPSLQIAFQLLGEALVDLVPGFEALAPLIPLLAESFKPLAGILTQLVIAAAPFAGEILRLLADVLTELQPIAGPVGQALGLVALSLADLFVALSPILTESLSLLAGLLIAILDPLEPIARELIPVFAEGIKDVFDELRPVLPHLAEFAAILAGELVRNLPALTAVAMQFFTVLGMILGKLGGEWIQVLEDMMPYLPQLADEFTRLAIEWAKTLPVLSRYIPLMLELFGLIFGNGATIRGLIMTLTVLANILEFVNGIFEKMAPHIERGEEMFRRWIERIREGSAVVGAFATSVQAYINYAIAYVATLPQQIVNVLGDMSYVLYNSGRQLITGLINGLIDSVPFLSGVLREIAAHARAFWPFSPAEMGPLSGRGDMRYAGISFVHRLGEGMAEARPSLAAQVADLAGLFAPAGGLPALAGAGGGSMSLATGPTFVTVQIGDRVIDDAVTQVMTSQPGVVANAAREGDRRNAWTNSGRRRIGNR